MNAEETVIKQSKDDDEGARPRANEPDKNGADNQVKPDDEQGKLFNGNVEETTTANERRSILDVVVGLVIYGKKNLERSIWPRFWLDLICRFTFAITLGVLIINVSIMASMANLVAKLFNHQNDDAVLVVRDRSWEFLSATVQDMNEWLTAEHGIVD